MQREGWSLRAELYRNRAIENYKLAEITALPTVRERYLQIAAHYLALADAEQRSARGQEPEN
jgi:hypothetical protein